MKDFERFDGKIAQFKAVPGDEQSGVHFSLQVSFQRFLSGPVAIDGHTQFLSETGQTLDMIGMFMRDQHGVQAFGRASNSCKPFADLAEA